MTIFHGIKINEPLTGARTITDASSAVIGLVAVSSDAVAGTFPLNKPQLVTNLPAAIADAGTNGTLARALREIANQGSPVVVVVRVLQGVASQGVTVEQATDANVVGTTTNNSFTGMQALLAAEAQCGVKPQILGCPGLDSQVVASALAIVAAKLDGFAYVSAFGDDVADVLDYREEFAARELMAIWPEFTGGPVGSWAGKTVAIAMGLRAALDEREGWHKSLSNVAVAGVTGTSKDVHFALGDMSTDAGLLNSGDVTTMIRLAGYRFWGNRTCSDEPLFAFETSVRTAQAIKRAIAEGLVWAIDKPMTVGLVRDIVESINATLRRWIAQGRLIGATCWYDPASNEQADLSAGQLIIDFDFTPVSPLEGLTINQRITGKYYAGFADVLSQN